MKKSTQNHIYIKDDDTLILKTNTDNMKAVGIVYEGEELLPQVNQSAMGESAKILIDNAFKLGIKVKQDPDLTEVLSALEIGQYIPPQAFEAVAEIIFYLYRESGINAPLLDFNQILKGEMQNQVKGYKTAMLMKEKNSQAKENTNENSDNDILSVIDHQAKNKFIER